MKTYTFEQIKEAGKETNIHPYDIDKLIEILDETKPMQTKEQKLLETILKNVVYFTDFNAIKKAVEDYTSIDAKTLKNDT